MLPCFHLPDILVLLRYGSAFPPAPGRQAGVARPASHCKLTSLTLPVCLCQAELGHCFEHLKSLDSFYPQTSSVQSHAHQWLSSHRQLSHLDCSFGGSQRHIWSFPKSVHKVDLLWCVCPPGSPSLLGVHPISLPLPPSISSHPSSLPFSPTCMFFPGIHNQVTALHC